MHGNSISEITILQTVVEVCTATKITHCHLPLFQNSTVFPSLFGPRCDNELHVECPPPPPLTQAPMNTCEVGLVE